MHKEQFPCNHRRAEDCAIKTGCLSDRQQNWQHTECKAPFRGGSLTLVLEQCCRPVTAMLPRINSGCWPNPCLHLVSQHHTMSPDRSQLPINFPLNHIPMCVQCVLDGGAFNSGSYVPHESATLTHHLTPSA